MGRDDNGIPGDPSGGRRGRTGVLDQGPAGIESEAGGTQALKTVRLVCLFCREVRLIHVPADCDTPREVLWECLACQERWASRK